MITQLIEFDVKKDSHVKITAKEGDINSRNLEFRLLDNSLPFSLAGRTVRCYMVKPDKRIVFSELKILDAEDGRCVLTLTTQSLIKSGMANMELIIYEEGKKLSTIPIKMNIIKSLASDELLYSSDEFGALESALWKIDTFTETINSKASKEDVKKLNSQLDTKAKQLDKKIDEVAQTGTTIEIVQNKVSEMAQNGSITFNTVTPEMTTFVKKIGADNLYNNVGYIDNKRVNENGQLVDWDYCFTLELFEVKPNTTYSFSTDNGKTSFQYLI